jgi:hypothetical protein
MGVRFLLAAGDSNLMMAGGVQRVDHLRILDLGLSAEACRGGEGVMGSPCGSDVVVML